MLRLYICLPALLFAAAPAAAATVLDYSLYALGNYTEQGGSRIGGGIAVAGNATINSASIGSNLNAASNSQPVVVVGGTLRYDNSTLAHGNVVYGAGNASGQYTAVKTPGGSVVQGDPIAFADISKGLLGLSARYAADVGTGAFSTLYGAGMLTGTSVGGTDVFSLTTADLSGVYALKLIGSPGTKAIINVTGTSFNSYFSFDRGNYAVSDIVFNFTNATDVTFNGNNLAASVLAPLANFTQNGGIIGGSLVAKNYNSAGAQIVGDGHFDMGGAATGAVPEPANWVMLIAGFGLVGATMRRRRAVRAVAA